jgi:Fe-S-cluster containining protein
VTLRGGWRAHPARSELLALYTEIDALLAPASCPASADCCHFGRIGREPYVHTVELAEVMLAARPAGLDRPRRSLPLAPEGRCPMLGQDGRCRIYAHRPFGCRTYFCEKMESSGKLPRSSVRAVERAIADLSARVFPQDPGPRPLTRALSLAARTT